MIIYYYIFENLFIFLDATIQLYYFNTYVHLDSMIWTKCLNR